MPKKRRVTKNLGYAFSGIVYAFKSELSFRIEIIAAFFAFGLAATFQITAIETSIIIVLITSILVLEMLNTIIERIVDVIKPSIHPYAKHVKDMMAGAVLIASVAAIFVGFFIFFPYIRASLSVVNLVTL